MTVQNNYEKMSLLENDLPNKPKAFLCRRVLGLLLTFTLSFIVVAYALVEISPVWMGFSEASRLTGEVDWTKFTTFATSVVNEKHFVWKFLWDQEGNRFRVDAIQVQADKDVELRVEAAKQFLMGDLSMELEQHMKPIGSPVTMLFVDGGVYGIYAKDGEPQVPQCRHYDHDFKLPTLDPLNGATEHGLSYAHNYALTNHYSDANWPHHGSDSLKNVKSKSELWVDAFSNKPLAAEVEGTFEKDGKKHSYHGFHHFFKFMNWVDESHLTPPKQLTGVCREVGHSGEFTNTDELSDFENLLAQFLLF